MCCHWRHHRGNCAPLVQAGADFLAVVGAVWNHPGGAAEGVKDMLRAIEAARGIGLPAF